MGTPRRHVVACAEFGSIIIESTGHIVSKRINEIPGADAYHDIIKFDVKEWEDYHLKYLPDVFDFCDLGMWYRPNNGSYLWRYIPPCDDWRNTQGQW